MQDRIGQRFAYGDHLVSSSVANVRPMSTAYAPSAASLRERELLRTHLGLTISLFLVRILVRGVVPAGLMGLLLWHASGLLTQVAEAFPV
ncbi:hypothetical protein [Rhodocyclus purpureus]|uniref:hypothetical protein n=1 Tax=Rhodocyclus purpureus TaxID=1067 RepID=UPI0019149A80|nr:hypothetical protein [Rhodocyclus purpureus]